MEEIAGLGNIINLGDEHVYSRVEKALAIRIDQETPKVSFWRSKIYPYAMEVQLPDSSKVCLNAGSTLQYPVAFNSKTRTVTLKEGDAYFEIKHDLNKPFIIHTRTADINVLGTTFKISAYEKEADAWLPRSNGIV